MAAALRRLETLVRETGLSLPEFESRVLKLSPQESRMFSRLLDGDADTVQIRNGCSIGNVSEVAGSLNRKLEAAGDPRRVVCDVTPHRNRYGELGRLGTYRLTKPESGAVRRQAHAPAAVAAA